jgi:hypothetical protein
MKYLLLITISVFFLDGCVSYPEYPKNWPAIDEDETCRNIEGYFEDSGENLEGLQYSTSNSIYLMLTAGDPRNSSDVRYIQITQDTNELIITAHLMTFFKVQSIHQASFLFDNRDCKNGFLEIRPPDSTKSYPDNLGFNITKFSYKLAMATDGSLVVSRRSYSAASISVVPAHVRSADNWFLFKAIDRIDE